VRIPRTDDTDMPGRHDPVLLTKIAPIYAERDARAVPLKALGIIFRLTCSFQVGLPSVTL
jgi:hypothetical protein